MYTFNHCWYGVNITWEVSNKWYWIWTCFLIIKKIKQSCDFFKFWDHHVKKTRMFCKNCNIRNLIRVGTLHNICDRHHFFCGFSAFSQTAFPGMAFSHRVCVCCRRFACVHGSINHGPGTLLRSSSAPSGLTSEAWVYINEQCWRVNTARVCQ